MAKVEIEGSNRKERLAQLKKGTGVFVYDGTALDVELKPTPLRRKANKNTFDLDENDRMVPVKAGSIVRDDNGKPVMGGKPERIEHKVKVYKLWGREFPAGEPVEVADTKLARKLRAMAVFDEVEPGSQPQKRGPGRPKKPAEA